MTLNEAEGFSKIRRKLPFGVSTSRSWRTSARLISVEWQAQWRPAGLQCGSNITYDDCLCRFLRATSRGLSSIDLVWGANDSGPHLEKLWVRKLQVSSVEPKGALKSRQVK